MWNDEDNNPYGTSFDRRDSQTSSSANPTSPGGRDCEHFPFLAPLSAKTGFFAEHYSLNSSLYVILVT